MNPDQQVDLPELRDPILIAAFEGWNDAGDAASDAIEHLALSWDAEPLIELDCDEYYDYQAHRPTVKHVDGVSRRIEWPTTSLYRCHPPGLDRDIVLLRGIEPNLRWRRFADEIVGLAERLGIQSSVILGALLADTPHTRPVPVTGVAFSTESAERFKLTESRYEGPTGITGVLQDRFVTAGLPAVSFWAAVPHYVSTPPNPKATVALLTRVEEVIDAKVPLGNLPEQAEEWESAVTEITHDDDEIAEYVRALEERGDAETDVEQALADIDGDALAAEFEKYLRRRGPGDTEL